MRVEFDPSRCKEWVFGGWHSYQCSRSPVDDTPYCKQHNPARVAKKAKLKSDEYKAYAACWDIRRDISQAESDLLKMALIHADFRGMAVKVMKLRDDLAQEQENEKSLKAAAKRL